MKHNKNKIYKTKSAVHTVFMHINSKQLFLMCYFSVAQAHTRPQLYIWKEMCFDCMLEGQQLEIVAFTGLFVVTSVNTVCFSECVKITSTI